MNIEFDYDICIIGGGILGCMAARYLASYNLRTLLLEEREDVCTGITKANMAIVYAGYDNRPGSLKSKLCVEGNQTFSQLCQELGVQFQQCGSLMVCFGEKGEKVLQKKYEQGIANGVQGMQLLSASEVLELEPKLTKKVYKGLYTPVTGVVNPWELGIAAWENAMENGCHTMLSTMVTSIKYLNPGFEIQVKSNGISKHIRARGVMNCAGVRADEIRELIQKPSVRIYPTAAEFCVFDEKMSGMIRHVIFYEPEEKGKGITLVPTTDGNILLGASEQGICEKDYAKTTEEGQMFLQNACRELIPEMDFGMIIRSFAGVRPNPFEVFIDEQGVYNKSDKSIHSFVIDQCKDMPEMISLLGIKTPGLTCSHVLTKYAADHLLKGMGINPERKKNYDPKRTPRIQIKKMSMEQKQEMIQNNPSYGNIVCYCQTVTEGEILDALQRGAKTVEAVKRRCNAGMGRCQGGRCTPKIVKIIESYLGEPAENIKENKENSWIIKRHLHK